MSKTQVHYSVDEYQVFGLTVEGLWDLEDESDQDLLVSECAKDYWDEHDGWEASWPLEIALYKPGSQSNVLAKFEVDMEWDPSPCVQRRTDVE